MLVAIPIPCEGMTDSSDKERPSAPHPQNDIGGGASGNLDTGAPADPDDLVGKTVSHYLILEIVGGGGMGVVYRARDTRLDRIVALKFLPRFLSHDADARGRFFAEARAASAIDHPNICTVHEIGETSDGRVFIAMASYRGETLKKKISRGPVPVDEALDYVAQAARGLAKAHAKNIIHRDIKPANLMITEDGVLKILDFGIAKVEDLQLTQTGTSVGTGAYMSPEQAYGEGVDQRTDLWSLGVVLYEMLTGEQPFKGDRAAAVIVAMLHQEPKDVRELNPDVTAEVATIVAMCLEKEPDDRYADADALLADLASLLPGAEAPGGPRRDRRRSDVRRPALRRGVLIAVALLALALLLPGSRDVIFRSFGGGGGVAGRIYVAVLPFASTDPETEVLAAGLMQSITGMIARYQASEDSLWVVPASEVITSGVVTAAEARSRFGVTRVLTGTMQPSPANGGVLLELVDPDPNRTRVLNSATLPTPSDPGFATAARAVLSELLGVSGQGPGQSVAGPEEAVSSEAYAFYLQGIGYLQRKDRSGAIESAISLFTRALSEDSTFASAHAGLCEARWERFRVTNDTILASEALQSCDRAAELGRDQSTVLVPLASIYLQTGQAAKAEETLRGVIERERQNATAYRWMGRALEARERNELAEQAYREAIRLRPDVSMYHEELGEFLLYAGRYEDAVTEFQQMIRLTPDNYLGYNNLGVSYLFRNQDEEAAHWFRAALERRPNSLAFRNLGYLRLRAGELEEAIPELQRALELNEADVWAWRWLAHARRWLGEDQASEEAVDRMMELATALTSVNARDTDALTMLAEGHVMRGEPDLARTYLDRLSALPVTYNYSSYFIGRLYEMLGNRDAALNWFERALEEGFDPQVGRDPWLRDLRSDPRYVELQNRFSAPVGDPGR
jgi:serine/threonine protein kinase/tetratricopeptide (TPR) repeat protein